MNHCVKQSNQQHNKHTFLSINLEWKYSLANDDITLVKFYLIIFFYKLYLEWFADDVIHLFTDWICWQLFENDNKRRCVWKFHF